MSDDIAEVVTDEVVNEETKTVDQVKNEKTFTQEQLNKAVTDRVSREKANTKKLQEQYETEKGNYVSQLESYESILSKLVEEKRKDLPENYQKIVSKLGLLEQWEILNDPTANKTKKIIPSTPPTTGNEKKPVSNFKQLF